ncbi:uncharacterized protein LOC133690520 isoform X1 [Populus nigra]|uniref:uncharacterized protein LOC133690520 isoform X1 n=1 Tax=Populus nigra TaxID=3691 RepID=UPI002B26799C|nr:uncharacterized protein LOC133690520 isoform X1 [Populus nigra]
MGVVLYYFADWLEIKELNKKIVKKEEDSKKTKGSVATAQNVKERERKVYDFLGQKRDPPEEFSEKKLTLLLGSSRPRFISAPSSATPLKVWRGLLKTFNSLDFQ